MSETSRLGQNSPAFQSCDLAPVEGRQPSLYFSVPRGIGLLAKVQAYHLQDEGADTVEANQKLGFAADLRSYSLCDPMLKHLGIRSVKLMTNNPRKVSALQNMQVKVEEQIPLIIARNPYNERYLATKASKLGHMLVPDL